MKKPMWNSEAVKAYETGQGVELVTTPHPHYRPLPKELESQEPVAHCEAGPEFCQQCHKESLPTYGSEEVSKLREVIQSQAKIIADYEKQIDEPAIYPEEAYEMGLEAIAYYTHPPQRTWVGLTDEDCRGMSAGDRLVAMWADRTLKEKNT